MENMTAAQEVFRAVGLFSLFFIVIPVGVFAAGLIINYYKEVTKNDLARHSHRNPRG